MTRLVIGCLGFALVSISITPANVLSVHAIEAVPEEMRVPGVLSVLRADAPGTAHVEVHATFDDGTSRTTEFDVGVARASEVKPASRPRSSCSRRLDRRRPRAHCPARSSVKG